jgi:putative Holliday junction resolvase
VRHYRQDLKDLDKDKPMGNKRRMRIMGLDVGSHTIGIAISDELGMTAQGLKTIKRSSTESDFAEIKSIIIKFGIERIVVGLPKNMDGTLGKGAEAVFRWIEALTKRIDLPVVTWDERLSTVEATKILLEADLSRRKRKAVIDKVAAVIILQGYLDHSGKQNDESLLSA